MRLLHAADLHLDSPMQGLVRYDGAPVAELQAATRRAFEGLVRACITERAEALLLAGDLFDGEWRDMNTGVWLTRALAPLGEAGVQVLAVRGNHDAASEVTRHLRWPAHVHLFGHDAPSTWVDERRGLAVHGMSYPRREVREDLVPRYPAPRTGLFNVGLLHTNVGGRPGHADYAPTAVSTLAARGYAYWALGHVHQPATLHEAPWVVYPGNLQGRSIRETGPRGAVVVDVDEARGEVRSVRPIALDVARWERLVVELGPEDGVDELCERVRAGVAERVDGADGRTLAVRVEVTGACRAHAAVRARPEEVARQVREAAAHAAAWVEKVRLGTRERGAPPAEGGIRAAARAELAALAGDAQGFAELLREDMQALAGLRRHLELAEGESADPDDPRLDDAAWLASLAAEVGDELDARLAGEG